MLERTIKSSSSLVSSIQACLLLTITSFVTKSEHWVFLGPNLQPQPLLITSLFHVVHPCLLDFQEVVSPMPTVVRSATGVTICDRQNSAVTS